MTQKVLVQMRSVLRGPGDMGTNTPHRPPLVLSYCLGGVEMAATKSGYLLSLLEWRTRPGREAYRAGGGVRVWKPPDF